MSLQTTQHADNMYKTHTGSEVSLDQVGLSHIEFATPKLYHQDTSVSNTMHRRERKKERRRQRREAEESRIEALRASGAAFAVDVGMLNGEIRHFKDLVGAEVLVGDLLELAAREFGVGQHCATLTLGSHSFRGEELDRTLQEASITGGDVLGFLIGESRLYALYEDDDDGVGSIRYSRNSTSARMLLAANGTCLLIQNDADKGESTSGASNEWDVCRGTYKMDDDGCCAVCSWYLHFRRTFREDGYGGSGVSDKGWRRMHEMASLRWQRPVLVEEQPQQVRGSPWHLVARGFTASEHGAHDCVLGMRIEYHEHLTYRTTAVPDGAVKVLALLGWK